MGTWEPGRLAVLGISIFLLLMPYFLFREGIQYRRIAARQNRETQDFLSRAVRAPALVVGVEEQIENLNLGKYYRNYRDFCPVVQFQTWQGQPVQTRVEVGIEKTPPQIGQQVEICYDAVRPQRARLNGPGLYPPRTARRGFSGCLMFVNAAVMAVCGIIGTLGAIFIP